MASGAENDTGQIFCLPGFHPPEDGLSAAASNPSSSWLHRVPASGPGGWVSVSSLCVLFGVLGAAELGWAPLPFPAAEHCEVGLVNWHLTGEVWGARASRAPVSGSQHILRHKAWAQAGSALLGGTKLKPESCVHCSVEKRLPTNLLGGVHRLNNTPAPAPWLPLASQVTLAGTAHWTPGSQAQTLPLSHLPSL